MRICGRSGATARAEGGIADDRVTGCVQVRRRAQKKNPPNNDHANPQGNAVHLRGTGGGVVHREAPRLKQCFVRVWMCGALILSRGEQMLEFISNANTGNAPDVKFTP